ncbi:MAG: hypothetical protein NZL96_02345 [Patescibacteria group bacterium]|nr:hypothetical protein [Patescibacteria group bacterium]
MPVFLIIVLIFFLVITFFFLKFISPVPYFPSHPKDLPLIIKAFNLRNNQAVVDLGAGDGSVILKAAQAAYQKKLTTKFFAFEINPILVLIIFLRRLVHSNKKNIKIFLDDLFDFQIKKINLCSPISLTFYLYLSPWYLEKVLRKIKKISIENQLLLKELKIVSYFYPLPKIKPSKIFRGKVNTIYVYRIKE